MSDGKPTEGFNAQTGTFSQRTLWLLHDERRAEQGEPAEATAGISSTCRQADRSFNKMRSCYTTSLLTNMNWHPQPAYISTLWTHYAVRCLTSYFLNKCWWGGSYCGQETDNFAGFWPPFHYHWPRGDESSVGTNSTLWVQHLRKVAGSESLPHDILFDLLISEKSQETFLGVFCLFFFFFLNLQ